MKIALAQINFTIADIEGNTAKIIEAIGKAKAAKIDLIVFSELSVCAYMPDDLLDYPHFIEQCRSAIEEITKHTQGITAIVGSPTLNSELNGRKLHNSASVLSNGLLQKEIHKTLLPTYDVFNESRYFESNEIFQPVEIAGKNCAITICEDLWSNMDRFNYKTHPVSKISEHNKVDLIINISASPFNYKKKTERFNILKTHAVREGVPLVYVNQTGVHSDLIFDGNSMVLNEQGELVLEMPVFADGFEVFDTEQTLLPIEFKEVDAIENLYNALVYGISNFFDKLGFKKAILGSSGGIDSAVVQALASEAIGAENVTAVLMPSQFSSAGSINHAEKLSNNLGNPYHIIPIHETVQAYEKTLKPLFKDLPFNVAEENIQARSRAVILMAISNKFGQILLNTSNKSEMAVGYTTLYGDMCGSLSVMGDVYKTAVYKLANFINKEKEIIPSEIINKAPSAELRPGQKDSDSLPDYAVLDAVLELYIEQQKGEKEIINQGFEAEMVRKIILMVNRNEYKRFQAPPILRVTSKAFGRGRQIPLVSKW